MKIKSLILFSIIINSFLSLESQLINFEVDKSIAILTINRQKALNALNSQVLEEIDKTLDRIDLTQIKALIITGSGEKSFVAGADIGEMSKLTKKRRRSFWQKRK